MALNNEIKEVAWNASQGIIMEISNRRAAANTNYISGRIKIAMNNLIAIKQSVIQSIKDNERKELRIIESKFNQISPALSIGYSNSFNSKDRKIFLEANSISKKIYSEYNDKLMDILQDRGYLVGEKSDASHMKF